MANLYRHTGSSISKEEWEKALELAERWKEVSSDASYGPSGKNLGVLSRAFLHLKVCYDELAKSRD